MAKKTLSQFIPAVILIILFAGVAIGYALFGGGKTNGDTDPTSTGATWSTTTDSGAIVCTTDYSPVCASDGRTYSNRCVAEKQNGLSVVSEGMCVIQDPDPLDMRTGSTNASGGTILNPDENTTTAPEYIDTDTSTPSRPNEGQTNDFLENIDVPGETNPTSSTNTSAPTTTDSATTQPSAPNTIPYDSQSFGYGFDMPRNSYYQASGARDGAIHSVAVSVGTGVTSFEDATVRVLYYNSLLAPLDGNDTHVITKADEGKTYVRLDTNKTVVVEGDINSAAVKTVVESVRKARAPATATGSTTTTTDTIRDPDAPIGQ